MKAILTYYSYSGITEKVAHIFEKCLGKKGEVTTQRLCPVKEIRSFAAQCLAASMRKRVPLQGDVVYDMSPYDLIVIGLPVWAFAPVPALNTFLDKVNGMSGKRAVVFVTSGSGAGVARCLKAVRTVLEAKGISHIEELNIPNRKMGEENFIYSLIEGTLSQAIS